MCAHDVHCTQRHARVFLEKKENIAEESWHQRTTEASALRGHFIALLWSSEVHQAQFHHNNGKEGRRDKRGLSLLLNPFTAGRSVSRGTERTTPGQLRSSEGNDKRRVVAHVPAVWQLLIHTHPVTLQSPRYTHTHHIRMAAFLEQEEAVGSFTSASSHTEMHCRRLSMSFHLCPSFSLSLPPLGTWTGYYTFTSEFHFLLCVFVWILKMGKEGVRGKGCSPAIALFLFFSL